MKIRKYDNRLSLFYKTYITIHSYKAEIEILNSSNSVLSNKTRPIYQIL